MFWSILAIVIVLALAWLFKKAVKARPSPITARERQISITSGGGKKRYAPRRQAAGQVIVAQTALFACG